MRKSQQLSWFLVSLLYFVVFAYGATKVSWCQDDQRNENEVDVGSCLQPPCSLHLGTTAKIQIKFTPNTDVETLTNKVKAKIFFGIPLPFFGVDGTDACQSIYKLDGEVNGCPLTKGQTYLYKNEFPVLRSYPRISLTVQWALKYESDDVVCFEVPAELMY